MIRKVIAGVALTAEQDPDLILNENKPVEEAFYSSNIDVSADHRIHLRIHSNRMPVFTNQPPLFNANDSWFVYRDDSFYWVVLHPPAFDDPLWVVRMAPEFTEGDVYYSRMGAFHPISYPLDQILMMHFLARIGGMIIHAAGWAVNDSGWIFAGKSGAGKSTISNLIVAATGGTFLSDDRIIIRKIGQEFLMYGTPWPGDAGYAVNASVPLKGIFFLSRGDTNSIRVLTPADAIARLMPVASIPWYDPEKVTLMMDFCNDLLCALPMYELRFVPDKAVVGDLERFIENSTKVL